MNVNLYKVLIVLTIVFSVSACSPKKAMSDSSKETTKNEAAVEQDSLFVSIQRTSCYGRCPSYKAYIYKSGYAVYEGKRFVDKLGTYTANLHVSDLDRIKDKAKEINYFSLLPKYDSNVSDFPTCFTIANIDGVRKEISNRDGAPIELKEYEKLIDDVLNQQKWNKKAETDKE